jgi:hypothetical protein
MNINFRIHYLKLHHDSKKRLEIFPLLRPFLKVNPIDDCKRQAIYHISEKEVEFVEHEEDAEICILTMSWNYYADQNLFEVAKAYVKKANLHGKKVWTWMSGDFGVPLKLEGDYIVFRNSGHKSKLSNQHIGMPLFIKDSLQEFYSTNQLIFPEYNSIPIVGFCGQANSSLQQIMKELTIRIMHLIMFKLGKNHSTPQPIQSTSQLRVELLNTLKQSKEIRENFIKRKKYRAGISLIKNKNKHKTTREFYDNILASNYILCVRGGGNFSVRFCETLAMGRIPVFVNTDCLLPLEAKIDWKKHCVWVEFEDRKQIAEKVIAFHQKHTKESLLQLMQSNRDLWESKLRMKLFFKESYLKAQE